jgi:hypothetical protein
MSTPFDSEHIISGPRLGCLGLNPGQGTPYI